MISLMSMPPIDWRIGILQALFVMVVLVGSYWVGLYFGKKLKGKHLVIVSLVYLAVALASFVLVIPLFVGIFLSNVGLDVGLFISYSTQKQSP